MTLEAACGNMPPETLEHINKNAEKISRILIKHGFVLSSSEINHIIISIQCNAHKVVDSDGAAVALGLFPMTSMINHSCTPNAVHSFQLTSGECPRLIMHAISDIAVETEICYSYVQLYQSTAVRKDQLRSAYSFDCICLRCRENSSHTSDPTEPMFLNDFVINESGGSRLVLKEVEVCIGLGNKESGKLLSLNKLLGILGNADKSSEIPIGSKVFLHICVSITNSACHLIGVDTDADFAQIAFGFGAISIGCIYAFTKIESVEIGKIAACCLKAIQKLIESNAIFEDAKFSIHDSCVTLPLTALRARTLYTDGSYPYSLTKFLIVFRDFCQLHYVMGDDILSTVRRLMDSNFMTESTDRSLGSL